MKIVMKFPAPHNVGTTEYRIVYEYLLDLLESNPLEERDVIVGYLRELARVADDVANIIEGAHEALTLTTAE